MLAGELYNANYDEELINERNIAKEKCFEYNNIKPSDTEKRTKSDERNIRKYRQELFNRTTIYL